MKQIRESFQVIFLFLAVVIFAASCSSTTVIQSEPPGARLFINGEYMGTTPYTLTDTKTAGTTNWVRLEMNGFETLYTSFSRTERVEVGAIVAGIFLWIPFAWGLKYKPYRSFLLAPLDGEYEEAVEEDMEYYDRIRLSDMDKFEALREIKNLYDEGILTKEEFEKEKKRILQRPE
jgi:hypothetical protein